MSDQNQVENQGGGTDAAPDGGGQGAGQNLREEMEKALQGGAGQKSWPGSLWPVSAVCLSSVVPSAVSPVSGPRRINPGSTSCSLPGFSFKNKNFGRSASR